MVELSYSLHLGNDKNKSKKARKTAKLNQSGTTSLNNNSIQNLQQLSKVDKHNLRKYDDEQEIIIKGTSSVVEDTIDMLEDKVSKLQETLDYFKELWNKFIKFLQDKFFSSNKYDDIIDELHEEEIIDDDDLDVIENEYSSYRSKDDYLER